MIAETHRRALVAASCRRSRRSGRRSDWRSRCGLLLGRCSRGAAHATHVARLRSRGAVLAGACSRGALLAWRLLPRLRLARRGLAASARLGRGSPAARSRCSRGSRGLAARAARLVAAAATAAAAGHGRGGGRRRPRSRRFQARHLDAREWWCRSASRSPGRGRPRTGEARVKEWPVLPARPVRPMRWT